MKNSIIFIFVICNFCLNILCNKNKDKKGDIDDSDFCYVDPKCGPKNWAGLCQTGTRQSPIDFDGHKLAFRILPPNYRQFYVFSIAETKTFLIQNTGNNVQVEFPLGKEPTLEGATIGLPGSYRFSRLVFHWGRYDKDGSEHRIAGKGYAMELQIVHYSTHYLSYEQALATEDPYAIAIISILYEIGPLDNLALKPITDSIPLIRQYNSGAEITVNRFLNLKALFPAFLSFYRYEGSLTTPGCLENHVWSVFKKPNTISKKQLEEFRSIFVKGNAHLMVDNHRILQRRNDRAVTLFFTPTNVYDWFVQFVIYVYTFMQQLASLPGEVLQRQISVFLRPFNFQNGLLGVKDIG